MTIAGKEGCPCTNTTATLASLTNRHCQLPTTGETGIKLTLAGGSCVPFSYGSSQCLLHDLVHDPSCQVDPASGESIPPAYCFRPFCYVDKATCVGKSDERVYRSSYFPFDSGADVFYSYSTCNATADDWFAIEADILGSSVALGGKTIEAAFPTYLVPFMYKRDPISQEVLSSPGSEFFDNSLPYEGVYMTYIQSIAEVSNGDIRNITITHRSRASSLVHPTSSFTATVQDIQDGLIDMGAGPFWITAQRLKMASFTLPIVYDKTYLVIPRPETKDTLSYQVSKVLAPFSYGLWGFILGIIAFSAMLTVWFSDRSEKVMLENQRRMGLRRNRPQFKRRKTAYARLCLDSFLEKGLFYCSAGVEQDNTASLPTKILLFGFGFFILIAVSAYVANLAAFLTLSAATDTVKTIDEAVARGYTICAHPAIKLELQTAFPEAHFYFHSAGNEFMGVLEDYDAGNCRVMAIGYEDTSLDTNFLNGLCERKLVYTESVIIEIPVAFPIRSEYNAGFSSWIVTGDRNGDATLQAAKDLFASYADVGCNVHIDSEVTEGSEYGEIKVKNMFFPIMFFTVFSCIAILLQIIHLWNVKQGKESLVGRGSTLCLVAETPGGPRKSTIGNRFGFAGPGREKSSKDDDEDDYWKSECARFGFSGPEREKSVKDDADEEHFIEEVKVEEEKEEVNEQDYRASRSSLGSGN